MWFKYLRSVVQINSGFKDYVRNRFMYEKVERSIKYFVIMPLKFKGRYI